MKKNLIIKLTDEQIERLHDAAQKLKTTPQDLAATFVEESLRARKYPHIEFRDSVLGRMAYLKGTARKVWMTVWSLRYGYDNDIYKMAAMLDHHVWEIEAAVEYAAAYPEEIEPHVQEQEAMTPEKMKELLPNVIIDAR